MATDVLILNTAVLDLRSPDFAFCDRLVGAGGLAKCATEDMPPYTQAEIAAYVDRGCATAGGPGNSAPLIARAGLSVSVGVNLGAGPFGGLDAQGRAFLDTLAGSGVDMSATVVHPALPTGTTFIHEATGGERGGIAYFPNANNAFDFETFKPHVKRLAPGVVYYMYSGLSDRGDANGGRDLAAFITWCRAQGCITIADSHTLTGNPQALIASGEPVPAYGLLAPLLGELDVFFTSADEARMIRNTLEPQHSAQGLNTRESILSFLDFVAARFGGQTADCGGGKNGGVNRTLNAQRSTLNAQVTDEGRGRTRLFGVTVKNGAYAKLVGPDGRACETVFCASRFMVGSVIDLVGAGDSFRAGLAAYIARHREAFVAGSLAVEEAVQMGNLMATLYVTAPLSDRYGNIPPFETMLRVVRGGQAFASDSELAAALSGVE
jgi:sugar/nucleoside kinase (ribokinase family)